MCAAGCACPCVCRAACLAAATFTICRVVACQGKRKVLWPLLGCAGAMCVKQGVKNFNALHHIPTHRNSTTSTRAANTEIVRTGLSLIFYHFYCTHDLVWSHQAERSAHRSAQAAGRPTHGADQRDDGTALSTGIPRVLAPLLDAWIDRVWERGRQGGGSRKERYKNKRSGQR